VYATVGLYKDDVTEKYIFRTHVGSSQSAVFVSGYYFLIEF